MVQPYQSITGSRGPYWTLDPFWAPWKAWRFQGFWKFAFIWETQMTWLILIGSSALFWGKRPSRIRGHWILSFKPCRVVGFPKVEWNRNNRILFILLERLDDLSLLVARIFDCSGRHGSGTGNFSSFQGFRPIWRSPETAKNRGTVAWKWRWWFSRGFLVAGRGPGPWKPSCLYRAHN